MRSGRGGRGGGRGGGWRSGSSGGGASGGNLNSGRSVVQQSVGMVSAMPAFPHAPACAVCWRRARVDFALLALRAIRVAVR